MLVFHHRQALARALTIPNDTALAALHMSLRGAYAEKDASPKQSRRTGQQPTLHHRESNIMTRITPINPAQHMACQVNNPQE
jgi:hypothetical protein